ncbi:uncharacterized protein [Primulina huaijiensis]|uniref:uncharacterized protein n=1 Tax=Primulina huaijiensis TaxID=1492673 RepID=UPI003CC7127D
MGGKKATNKSAEASTSNKCRRTRNTKKSKQGTNEKSKQETTAEDKLIHDYHEKKSACLYEKVPVLGVKCGLNVYPRLFCWGKSKIPLNAAGTETLLKRIDSTQILSIHPFFEEEKLLMDMNLVLNQETNRSEVKRFEKLVMKQMNDLKILRKRCAELEGEKVRRRMKGKRFVADKRDNVVESEEKVDKTEENMTFESPHDARANFGDFVDIVVNAVVSDLVKEKKELDESHSLNETVDESIGGSFVATSEVEKKTISQSSIVDHVRARDDRVKKKKVPCL